MPEAPCEILLVTPVWNDSARISHFGKSLATTLASSPLPIRWIIADDGSTEADRRELAKLQQDFSTVFPRVELHLARHHLGKGAVVREAWSLAPEADWLAFVDADGAVSAPEMLGLIQQAVTTGVSVLGIRRRTHHTRVVESPPRALAHRGFLLAVRLLLGLRCADPQCGAKVILGSDYRRIAHRLEENGLAFDSELLATLSHSGAEWIETPVNWIEKKGGKIHLLRDAFRMLRSLFVIRDRLI